ncbi:PSD1 and planctomycete cytochrome C domain-containing protein [Coraliomargarita akajimensis]|uniref:Cytochrome c domain-containing protein n=1 Tax=Coraliomargarita akajimensis (strain DSM 45221 / IAM 15411 / JCM 23193 / KCTC 12865 / 04OKA010-24) TaxID=583355 RepID=D5ENY1_CORAD|nr:PSD1 and planctomycete cytochrome C domain-containing protein [Coraliomargarita akajimensis]ADE53640.1 protein of unknown function DUF1549 [Coraliomargarita akajimensis DSM 45221]
MYPSRPVSAWKLPYLSLAWITALNSVLLLSSARAEIDFNRDVRPILSDKCYFCHGPDVENNKADLRLDLREAAVEMGAIVPGKPAESALIQRIASTDPDDVMPPPETHKTVSAEERAILEQWITDGAQYDTHWSYKPVSKPAADSIDAIVRAGLQQKGLSLSPPATSETLVRRVYLDTIGLPPSREQAKRYLRASSTNAYEALVDELLASPHFGENMATDWLDAVRYADSVGYHGDQYRDASPYRDYVIHAFNSNMSYQQFVTEQLAGDLLPDATLQQRVAASFNRLNQISKEGGIQNKEYLKKYQAERVRTTATALLGSTLACAECHDHKFDPFTAEDFYAFGAFFADILEKGSWAGNGKNYQEADISDYLKTHAAFEKDGFGPTISVPNRTFLGDVDAYEIERERRLDRMLVGTDKALEEYTHWLKAKRDIDSKGIPEHYPLAIQDNDRLNLAVPEDLDMAYAEYFTFSVFGKQQLPNDKRGFGLLVIFDDKEYLFYTNTLLAEGEQPKRQKRWIGSLSVFEEWKDYSIPAHYLGKHRSVRPKAIQVLATPLDDGSPSVEFRDVRLVTTRHKTPVDMLGAESKVLLDKYLRDEITPAEAQTLKNNFFSDHAASEDQVRLQLSYRAMDDYLNGMRDTPATISATPREIKILPRGNWMDESGQVVLPATPSFLEHVIASTPDQRLTRLDLAEWVVHRDNPLTARTYVNRVWAMFFGTPLSSAPEDLGLQGELPVYPELLDYLAYEFMDSGWDVKHLVKTILLSETYQQHSEASAELLELDPYNRLLARQNPRRLKAESVRDNALSVSGLLVPRVGGGSIKPYQPEGYYQHLNFPTRTYTSSKDENQYRRGVYMHWQRTFLHPMLIAFDAPSRDECAVARPVSSTPLQALNQLNDPTFVEAAIALAQSIVTDHPGDDQSRIQYAYQTVLTREPTQQESAALLAFLEREQVRYAESPKDAEAILQTGLLIPDATLNVVELAAWTSLSRALLNLHETITRY